VEQVNFFSERKKIADQYNQWLQENPQIKDCPFNVISYLESIGRLKNEFDMKVDKIKNPIIMAKKTITNADRIRNMTNEELAEILRNPCADRVAEEICDAQQSCRGCLLEWLQAEVKEGAENG
jgi:hypothetical protein